MAVTSPGMFPPDCDKFVLWTRPNRTALLGSRNTTMALIAESIGGPGGSGRPVVDETGLAGTYDFFLNFALETVKPTNPFSLGFDIPQDSAPDSAEPSFLQAVKDQLGMKLVPKEVPLQVLVIDHVEQPSPN